MASYNNHTIPQLVDHLFRHEAGKLVAVLTNVFGTQHLDLAEDVVQDSLVEAMSQWQFKGAPDNPSAWLFTVARNKALNILRREDYQRKYVSAVSYLQKSAPGAGPDLDHLFSEQEIRDDQLRMIFTCCHPSISSDSQIALALKTLCGFSISEISRAFLTTDENISKRLKRARQAIRDAGVPFEIPRVKDLDKRLDTVLETIYLLFNEGYSASKGDDLIRYELCEEAIRLARIIAADPAIQQKENVKALLALMFLNAARFKARQDSEGNLLTMAEQDRSLWDSQMRDTGLVYLAEASTNDSLSIYHILAAISAHYGLAPDYGSTDWKSILLLYDNLILLDNSMVVYLNRAIVLSKVKGAKEGLKEIDKIKDNPALNNYYLLHSTQAELFLQDGQSGDASVSFKKAIQLAPLSSIKELLEKKLDQCQ